MFVRTAREDSPFAEKLIGTLHDVEPLLVAEVEHRERTVRQPFLTDLESDEVLADTDLQVVIDQRPLQVRIRQIW